MMSRNFEGKLNYSDFNDFAWNDALLLQQKIKTYSQVVSQVRYFRQRQQLPVYLLIG